jgi:hypothetical protein
MQESPFCSVYTLFTLFADANSCNFIFYLGLQGLNIDLFLSFMMMFN